MVRSVDDNVGRVLTALEGLKVDDRTVVVFVSDNGGYVNEYHDRRVTTNEPLRSGKGSLYEGGIRVPLIIRVPKSLAGRSEAGIECRTPVITTDLYATCLSVANIEQPTAVDGLDLLPLTRGEDRSFHRQALFFHYPHFYATTTPASAIRADRWKLVHYYDTDRDELYDLATDLAETQDLAAERPEKRRRLRRWLDRWLGEVGAKLPLAAADSGRRQNE